MNAIVFRSLDTRSLKLQSELQVRYKSALDLHQNEKDKDGSVYYRHAVVIRVHAR